MNNLLMFIWLLIFLSLTVSKRENRCIPCGYWGTAIFVVVIEYCNLFPSFTLFLNCFHFTFGYELIIRSKSTSYITHCIKIQYIKTRKLTQKKQVLCGLQVLFLLFNCQTPESMIWMGWAVLRELEFEAPFIMYPFPKSS